MAYLFCFGFNMLVSSIRKIAKDSGSKRYFDGSMCKHGHISERMTSNARCCQCALEQKRLWALNKYKTSESYRKKVNKNNRDAKARVISLETDSDASLRRDRDSARNRKKYKNNENVRLRERAKSRNRIAMRKAATPPWYEKEKVEKVYLMGSTLGLEVDHIVPIKSDYVCGLHCWHNLQLLSKIDNLSKLNRFWPFMSDTKDQELIVLVKRFKDGDI